MPITRFLYDGICFKSILKLKYYLITMNTITNLDVKISIVLLHKIGHEALNQQLNLQFA